LFVHAHVLGANKESRRRYGDLINSGLVDLLPAISHERVREGRYRVGQVSAASRSGEAWPRPVSMAYAK
jgi:hypothetical protein